MLNFLRVVHDWEVDFFTSFFNLLHSFRLRRGDEDKFYWVPSNRGLFNVRSYYNVLIPHDITHFHWKSILWNKVPLRVTFFAWSAILGKILTMDNLRKRHVIVIDWCYTCKKNREIVDHPLLYCEIACALWNTIFNNVGLVWVMPSWVVDLYGCWRAQGGRPQLMQYRVLRTIRGH
jgi:hypothetical protein